MTSMQIYEAYLQRLAMGHSHAVTVTLKNDSPTEALQNRRMRLEETIRHLLYRISRLCFKNRHKRSNLCIGSVVVIENGAKLGRLHAHLSLACPDGIQASQFETLVQRAISRCRSLGVQRVIKPITYSDGWASYMAKEGPEAFSPQCTQHAKH